MKKEYVDSGRSKQKLKTRSKILASAQKFLREGQSFGLGRCGSGSGFVESNGLSLLFECGNAVR